MTRADRRGASSATRIPWRPRAPWTTALVAGAALLLSACPQRTALRVAEGSTARRLVFRLGDARDSTRAPAIGVLRVERCDTRGRERAPADTGAPDVLWVVGPAGGTAPWREVVYGVTPPGGVSEDGPRPLTPGCYDASISGTGRTRFDVMADGRVAERSAGGTR